MPIGFRRSRFCAPTLEQRALQAHCQCVSGAADQLDQLDCCVREASGADVREVARAIGTDSRIGPKFLNAGSGFGGSCFQKDILNLCISVGISACRKWRITGEVVALNTWQQHRIARLVVEKLFGTVTGKRLAILGFAFKADTNDTREAPAIRICRDLPEEGAQLAIHDPKWLFIRWPGTCSRRQPPRRTYSVEPVVGRKLAVLKRL